jgi:hypothetical protein
MLRSFGNDKFWHWNPMPKAMPDMTGLARYFP